MTRDERRQHLTTILDSYDAALAAYQRARWGQTLEHMRLTLEGMRALENAQADAIAALREANRAALAILRGDEGDEGGDGAAGGGERGQP